MNVADYTKLRPIAEVTMPENVRKIAVEKGFTDAYVLNSGWVLSKLNCTPDTADNRRYMYCEGPDCTAWQRVPCAAAN